MCLTARLHSLTLDTGRSKFMEGSHPAGAARPAGGVDTGALPSGVCLPLDSSWAATFVGDGCTVRGLYCCLAGYGLPVNAWHYGIAMRGYMHKQWPS